MLMLLKLSLVFAVLLVVAMAATGRSFDVLQSRPVRRLCGWLAR